MVTTALDTLISAYHAAADDAGPGADEPTITAARAERDELVAALRGVETWWLADGMKDATGAPHCIFAVREILSRYAYEHRE